MSNRLASATSPYLLQHADNPVDWQEWGSAAFAEARERDVPVLLSVGYAACHWCHVMAHESFEDEALAAYLNEHFVAIKVDREERPDVDAVYMQVTTALTGQGGWPMTCFLDADGKPFFAGTYFPDTPRHGQPSFTQLLQAVVDTWRTKREQIESMGSDLQRRLSGLGRGGDGEVGVALLDDAAARLAGEYDAEHAGFGGAPKFPPWMTLAFLQRHAGRTGSATSTRIVDETCAAMSAGGLYDQLGGGFARYSVDQAWVVPHFEKMLYDNAQALSLYAGWRDPRAETVARRTADFLLRELAVGDAFASSLDADSATADGGHEEGAFYAWSRADLEVLDEDAAWAATTLSVTAAGTFERGLSTLQLRAGVDDEARWERVRSRLLEARELRPRPARDDKVVAAWNGLAISGLVAVGRWDPAYVDAARRCGEFLWRVHWVDGRLRRVSRDGVVGSPAGVLEDYGCVATAYCDLAAATADPVWLERAGALLSVARARFRDEDGWHDTADDAEALLTRPRDPGDNASPSGTSSVVHALLRYAALAETVDETAEAEATLAGLAGLMAQAPRFAGWSLSAAEDVVAGPVEVVVVGSGAAAEELAAVAREVPGALVVAARPAAGLPLLVGKEPVGTQATAYLCRRGTCSPPVTGSEELRALLAR